MNLNKDQFIDLVQSMTLETFGIYGIDLDKINCPNCKRKSLTCKIFIENLSIVIINCFICGYTKKGVLEDITEWKNGKTSNNSIEK